MEWMLTNYIEIIAAVLGVAGVWLTTKQIIWCWPVGLLNVILSIIVFFNSKLYADVTLQIFYLIMTLYGWYNWLWGGISKNHLPVRKIVKQEIVIMLLAGIIFSFVVGFLFSEYTDAALPYIDSFVAVWGVIATYAMAKKITENWIMWIIIDAVCVGIYFYKELYAFTALYFVFVVLAVYGLIEWKKELRKILSE
jgi:nicotinamide mononucleotide transporter